MTQDRRQYGTRANAREVALFVDHVLETNARAEAKGGSRVPLCIWGRHGVGKTQLVEDLARKRGYQWVSIAPAQFEEMGDLIGMPAVEEGRTVLRPPSWVPSEEGPGIFLIDDVNRADDRILRGIMQLLQFSSLVSWSLPPKWQIVLTANPDGGDYSVTPMDDAMLTRMMHVTLEFDAKIWAQWALENRVDPRGVDFVLTYPEAVTGERTTPRTLVQFFSSIESIEDLNAHLPLVKMLADSCLDEGTSASFLAFVRQGLGSLLSPEEICRARDFVREVEEPIRALVQRETFRIDILAALCTRLLLHLRRKETRVDARALQNTTLFLKMDFLPGDLRFTMARDLVNSKKPSLKKITQDPKMAKLLLRKM